MSGGYEVPSSALREGVVLRCFIDDGSHSPLNYGKEDYEELDMPVSPNLMYAAQKAMMDYRDPALQKTSIIPPPPNKVIPQPTQPTPPTESTQPKFFDVKKVMRQKFLLAMLAVLLAIIIALCFVVYRLQNAGNATVNNPTTEVVPATTASSLSSGLTPTSAVSDPDVLSIHDPNPKYSSMYEAFAGQESMIIFYNEGIDFWKPLRSGNLLRTSSCDITTLPDLKVAIVPHSEVIIYSSTLKSTTFIVYDLGKCEVVVEKDVGEDIFHIRSAEKWFVVSSKASNDYTTRVYSRIGNNATEIKSFEYHGLPTIAPSGLVGFRIKEDKNIGLFDSSTNSVLNPLQVDFNFGILHFARNGVIAVIQEDNRQHYAIYDIPNRKLLYKGGPLKNSVYMPPNAVSEDGRNILFIITLVDSDNRRVENFVQVVRFDQSLSQIQFISELSLPMVPHWSIGFRKIGGIDHIQAVTEVTGLLKLWKLDETKRKWIQL